MRGAVLFQNAKKVDRIDRLRHLPLGGTAQRDRALKIACPKMRDGGVYLALSSEPFGRLNDTPSHVLTLQKARTARPREFPAVTEGVPDMGAPAKIFQLRAVIAGYVARRLRDNSVYPQLCLSEHIIQNGEKVGAQRLRFGRAPDRNPQK